MRLAFNGSFPVTTPFGFYDPVAYANYGGKHPGVDFATPMRTPLYAGMSGTLSRKLWGATLRKGNEAIITNGSYQRRYGHMDEITRPDGWVNEGELIGYSGNTGYSFGPHVHDELLIDGVYVDITKHLGAEEKDMPRVPIPPEVVAQHYANFTTNLVKVTANDPAAQNRFEDTVDDEFWYGLCFQLKDLLRDKIAEVDKLKKQLADSQGEFVETKVYVKRGV